MHETWHPTNNEPAPEAREALAKAIVSSGNFAHGLPVTLFAGQPVPTEGLRIIPPGGGELTVWPDGRFVFEVYNADPLATHQADMNLYYSYFMEDIDGSLVPGTMAVHAPESEERGSSRAWSIHEILDMEASLTSIFASSTKVEPLQEFADVSPDHHAHAVPGMDLLDYLFKTSDQG